MYTVTLIDDEYWALKGIADSVEWEKHGFQVVHQFTDPVEALEALTRQGTDVVFSDICMDAINGLEIISTLCAERPNSEFVVVSGYDRFEYAQKSLRLGVFDYLLKPIGRDDMRSLVDRLYAHLQQKQKAQARSEKAAPQVAHESLSRVLAYIQARYEQPLSLREIADVHFISETYICDLFRKYLDKTFSGYLQEVRMDRARFLLESTQHTISQIAALVGYADMAYFCRVFRRSTGHSPTQYRRHHQAGNTSSTET